MVKNAFSTHVCQDGELASVLGGAVSYSLSVGGHQGSRAELMDWIRFSLLTKITEGSWTCVGEMEGQKGEGVSAGGIH